MTSGSASYQSPARGTEETEKVIRTSVKEAEEVTQEPVVRNVFISFAVEDEAQVNLLRSQAKNPNIDFTFRDYSVKEPFDEKWKTQVQNRIAQTSATIVMIGPTTAQSEPVRWEIEESYKQGKKVFGVRIYSEKNYPIPRTLKDHNAPIINWDLDKINRLLQE